MAGYNGRRAPNVSQYVSHLNAIPSAHDVASPSEDNFNIENELAQFTNAEFLDFDAGKFLEQPAPEYGSRGPDEHGDKNAGAYDNNMNVKGLDFDSFPFPDLNSFIPNEQPPTPSPIQTPYAPDTNIYNSPISPISFNPAPYPGQKHRLSSPPATSATTTNPSPPSHTPEIETAASRLAAEEDKRRRNTAASARFRVKKKQREQALEQTAKDLENKALALKQRIGQLETENEWLRGLVVEKHGGEKEDLRLKWKKDGGTKEERKTGEGKKGVGTTEEGGKA